MSTWPIERSTLNFNTPAASPLETKRRRRVRPALPGPLSQEHRGIWSVQFRIKGISSAIVTRVKGAYGVNGVLSAARRRRSREAGCTRRAAQRMVDSGQEIHNQCFPSGGSCSIDEIFCLLMEPHRLSLTL